MKIGQLIEIAIGCPNSGHVNFSALHCILMCITEKLGMTDDIVDGYIKETDTIFCNGLSNYEVFGKPRLIGGSDPAEQNPSETPTPAEEISLQESHSAEVILEKVQDNDVTKDDKDAASDISIEDTSRTSHQEEDVKIVVNPEASISSQLSLNKIKERVTTIEMAIKDGEVPKEISSGISVMKDQLEFVIEQVLLLTFLTLSKKPDFKQIQHLYSMAQTLTEIKNENIFIEGFKRIPLPTAPSLDWDTSGFQLNEDFTENDILETHSIGSARQDQIIHSDMLDDHLCYSPSRLLDQLMELKGDICLLTNKMNELSARLLQQESQRFLILIQEIQEQMRDSKLTIANLKETLSRMELRLNSDQSNIENMKRTIEEILEEKVGKTYFDLQVANKVDYNQLQKKVSLDQILELQCRIDKKFCNTMQRISENDKKFSEAVENLKNTLGLAAIDGVLNKFKENITKDIQALHKLLKDYIETTNDECAAAGSRVKVLNQLTCLSCDNSCVMRTMEKAKVAKLPTAHASHTISPLVTYELGSIRKSGIMGYYRKNEFPHATNAWLGHQSHPFTNPKHCVPRHAGGRHTTNNAKERIQKTILHTK